MTDDGIITNRMLLEHLQAGDNALKQELSNLRKETQQGFQQADQQFEDMSNRFQSIDQKLEEAKEHRIAIEEDLKATIKMQSKHERELAVLTGRPQPEEY